jgi:hypothetical protein
VEIRTKITKSKGKYKAVALVMMSMQCIEVIEKVLRECLSNMRVKKAPKIQWAENILCSNIAA